MQNGRVNKKRGWEILHVSFILTKFYWFFALVFIWAACCHVTFSRWQDVRLWKCPALSVIFPQSSYSTGEKIVSLLAQFLQSSVLPSNSRAFSHFFFCFPFLTRFLLVCFLVSFFPIYPQAHFASSTASFHGLNVNSYFLRVNFAYRFNSPLRSVMHLHDILFFRKPEISMCFEKQWLPYLQKIFFFSRLPPCILNSLLEQFFFTGLQCNCSSLVEWNVKA